MVKRLGVWTAIAGLLAGSALGCGAGGDGATPGTARPQDQTPEGRADATTGTAAPAGGTAPSAPSSTTAPVGTTVPPSVSTPAAPAAPASTAAGPVATTAPAPPATSPTTALAPRRGAVVTLAVDWRPESQLAPPALADQRRRIEAAQDEVVQALAGHGALSARLTETAQLAVSADDVGLATISALPSVRSVQPNQISAPATSS